MSTRDESGLQQVVFPEQELCGTQYSVQFFEPLLRAESFYFMSTRTTLIPITIIFAIAGFLAYAPQLRTDAPAPVSEEATTTATLVVDGTSFSVLVSPEGTVLDAMRALSAEHILTFTTREYAGLGTFVESINGQKGSNSMNWMLYVNGVSASSGASATVVQENDVIEWKYEKGY